MSGQKQIPYSEVAKHNTADNCWVIIDDGVYNLTEALKIHPPGPFMINLFAGKDASWIFSKIPLHSAKVLKNKEKYRVGSLQKVNGEQIPNNSEKFILAFVVFMLIVSYFMFF